MKRTLSISKDHIRHVFYDLIDAGINYGIDKHPQIDLREKGIRMIAGVPESIADGWNILTDFEGELPAYLKEIQITPHSNYWKHMCEIDLEE